MHHSYSAPARLSDSASSMALDALFSREQLLPREPLLSREQAISSLAGLEPTQVVAKDMRELAKDMREPTTACFASLLYDLDSQAISLARVIAAKEKSLCWVESVGRFKEDHPFHQDFWENQIWNESAIDHLIDTVFQEFNGFFKEPATQHQWLAFKDYLKQNLVFAQTKHLVLDLCGFLRLLDSVKEAHPSEVALGLAEFPPEREELNCVPGTRLRLVRAIEHLHQLDGGGAQEWIAQSMLKSFDEYVNKSMVDYDLTSIVDEVYQVHLVSLITYLLGVSDEVISQKDLFFKTPLDEVPARSALKIIQSFDHYLHHSSEYTKHHLRQALKDFLLLVEKKEFDSPEYFEKMREHSLVDLIKSYKHDFNVVSEPFIYINDEGDVSLNEPEVAKLIHSTLFQDILSLSPSNVSNVSNVSNLRNISNKNLDLTYEEVFDEKNSAVIADLFQSAFLADVKKAVDILYVLSQNFIGASPIVFVGIIREIVARHPARKNESFLAAFAREVDVIASGVALGQDFLLKKLEFIRYKLDCFLSKPDFQLYARMVNGPFNTLDLQRRRDLFGFLIDFNAPVSSFKQYANFMLKPSQVADLGDLHFHPHYEEIKAFYQNMDRVFPMWYTAIAKDDIDLFSMYFDMDHQIYLKTVNSIGQNFIFQCVFDGAIQILADLQAKLDPQYFFIKDDSGNTPFHEACRGKSAEIFDFFLSFPAVVHSIAASNKRGETPLHFLMQGRFSDRLQRLLLRVSLESLQRVSIEEKRSAVEQKISLVLLERKNGAMNAIELSMLCQDRHLFNRLCATIPVHLLRTDFMAMRSLVSYTSVLTQALDQNAIGGIAPLVQLSLSFGVSSLLQIVLNHPKKAQIVPAILALDAEFFHRFSQSVMQGITNISFPEAEQHHEVKYQECFQLIISQLEKYGYSVAFLCSLDAHHQLPFEGLMQKAATLAGMMAVRFFQAAFKEGRCEVLEAISKTGMQIDFKQAFSYSAQKRCHPVFIESVELLETLSTFGFSERQLLENHPKHGSLLHMAASKRQADIIEWFLNRDIPFSCFKEKRPNLETVLHILQEQRQFDLLERLQKYAENH